MSRNCIQLEMNFNGSFENRFKDRLDNGEFQIFAELTAPSADTRLEDAVQRFADFEYAALSRTRYATALAFLDRDPDSRLMDLVSFASSICQSSRDSHLLYISGRNKNQEQVFGLAKHAISEGFKNFCLVSGLPADDADHSALREQPFTESVGSLNSLRQSCDESILTGVAVNPYQYSTSSCYNQYFKLVKKVSCGASFAVAQFGWDLKKMQEIRWNLFQRFLDLPILSRILFLTPGKIEAIAAGNMPGFSLSPDLEDVFQREISQGVSQFQAAQLRRLQLHAAGVRLLGFSGIQLGGIEKPEILESVLGKIEEAFDEFTNFEDWYQAYSEYYGRLEMAPYPYRFYMFENLLQYCQPQENLRMREAPLDFCSRKERWRYRLSKFLFANADKFPASERRLTKKLLASCHSCKKCRLPQTMFVCPEECPKGMANGVCGEVLPSGMCPYQPEKECIFNLRLRLAQTFNDYSSLEETVADVLPDRR